MDFSEVRFVAADMDGTLLNARHEFGEGFFEVFQELRRRGILFAAASGRQYFNLVNRFNTIKDEVIFIAENGSYVVYRGEELLVQAMDRDIVHSLLVEARDVPGAFTILCGKKSAYVESRMPRFIENVEMYYDRYKVVNDLLKVEDDEFLKIAICDLQGAESNSYPRFRRHEGSLQVKISGSIWLDLSHKLANKGKAMEVVQKKFGIAPSETMAFGDYLNDLEMMQKAVFSYAMENAHPDIKNASRFLAKSNEDNGVIRVLQEMLQSRRVAVPSR